MRNPPNRRSRPARSPRQPDRPAVLTEDFVGGAATYGDTLLFIGYEVNGLVEFTVYPRYRFSADDRVHGHLGYANVPFGTPWEEILTCIDEIQEAAERNYRLAVTLRSNELRSHGTRFEEAYDKITGLFRESWHGFSLKLNRENEVAKDGVVFSGRASGPLLARWRGEEYTVHVFPTGSILVMSGDARERLKGLITRPR